MLTKPVSVYELIGLNNPEYLVNQAGTFIELDSTIEKMGMVRGSDGKLHTAEDLRNVIGNVRTGLSITNLTRSANLRAKVHELISGSPSVQ